MARINIEDSLYKDIRFITLIGKLGSLEMALGAVVRAWSLAQEFILNDETDRLIPVRDWKRQQIRQEIIDVGLAEIRGDGIYVSGAEEQFSWLIQRYEAGKKGGRPSKKQEDKEELAPLSSDNRPLSPQIGSNPLSLSTTLSLTQDLSKKDNSVVVDIPPTSPQSSLEGTPTAEDFFPEILSLRHEEMLSKPLAKVKDETIRFWVKRYELDWLISELKNCVQYHSDHGNLQKFDLMNEWGARIGRWLRGARKPRYRDSGANIADEIRQFEAEILKTEGGDHEA